MPFERSKQLVYELDAWYRGHTVRQKDLAAVLGLSPQGLAEILALRNKPTGEQALRIAEFLNNNTMNTSVESPRTLAAAKEKIAELTAELKTKNTPAAPAKIAVPAPAARAAVTTPMPAAVAKVPTQAMTAWEKEVARAQAAATANLSSLPMELQTADQLRSALNAEKDPNARGRIYGILKARQAQANDAPTFDPEKDLNNFKKLEVVTPPPPKSLPADADTPVLIQKILDVTNFTDLQSMLGNPSLSPIQHSLVYSEMRRRRALLGANV
jgi:hypothetical protein